MQLIVIRRQPRHRNIDRVKRFAGRARDRRVRKEVLRAKIFAFWATKRARRIGPVNAVTDRQVVRLIQESAKHTARAAEYTVHPPKSHRLRNGPGVARRGQGLMERAGQLERTLAIARGRVGTSGEHPGQRVRPDALAR